MALKNILYISFFTSLLCVGIIGSAQQPSKSDLEKKRATLLKEIEQTQKQLEATKRDKNATLSDLKALQTKLNTRQQLINGINYEINNLDASIRKSNTDINILTSKLKAQQKSYAQTIRYAYKTRESENLVAFLFSAKDVNDALKRIQYLKKYNDVRKAEGDKIVKTQNALNNKINQLSLQKKEKSNLLNEEKSQTQVLIAEKAETDKIVQQLKGKETELTARIKKDQIASAKLESSIKEMIRKEIALAKKKAEEEAARKKAAEAAALAKQKAEEDARKKTLEAQNNTSTASNNSGVGLRTGSSMRGESATTSTIKTNSTPTTTTQSVATKDPTVTTSIQPTNQMASSSKPSPQTYKMSLTPEVQTISNNFSANQGRLPWPVEKGYISSHYGKQAHPLYASVTIDNIGIDITTAAGTHARSVFEGTVTKVSNIDGFIVMISHGEYFTIYSGLASVNVKQGDKVSAKQNLGPIGKNEDGVNILNFQIWKVSGSNFSTVNPSSWIAK